MPTIEEGSITISSSLFLPEVLNPPKVGAELCPYFRNFSETLLIKDQIPDSGNLKICGEAIGEFSGNWEFWSKLDGQELGGDNPRFIFKPQILIPDFDLELSKPFVRKYGVVDQKIDPRILYYPFGLFVVRVRVYFRFEDPLSVSEFIDFGKNLSDSIVTWSPTSIVSRLKGDSYLNWHNNRESIFFSLKKQLLKTSFDDEIPDQYFGQIGGMDLYPIIYVYKWNNFAKHDKARLATLDNRIGKDYAEDVTKTNLGRLEGDEIFVNKAGALIHTPIFSDLSVNSRRWKRIHLLNNVYLGSELARFEERYIPEISRELDRNLDEFTYGTLSGVPIDPKFLTVLRELLMLGNRLIRLRGDVYEQLQPQEKSDLQDDLTEYINRNIEHESLLDKLINMLWPNIN